MAGGSSNIHSGHRARMRKRYQETGLAGFDAHEALELILYSAIPKRDVNPLAHALIDRFGTLDAVLSAPRDELLEVPGVGPRTCELLSAFNEVCEYYSANRYAGSRTLGCIRDVLRRAREDYPRTNAQELIVMFEDSMGTLMNVRNFPARLTDPLVLRDILTEALTLRTHSVVLLMKGIFPLRKMNKRDLDEISRLIHLLSAAEIYVLDFIMLSGLNALSFRMEELLSDEQNGRRSTLPTQSYWYEPLIGQTNINGWRHFDLEDLNRTGFSKRYVEHMAAKLRKPDGSLP